MSTIAVQAAIGETGHKATTELSNTFTSLINVNGFQYGAGPNGLFQLNTGTTDDGTPYTSSVTFATSDFGAKKPKRGRYLYIGCKYDVAFTVQMKIDDGPWTNYTFTPFKAGLQGDRVSIVRSRHGRYFTFRITSTSPFKIDQVDGVFVVRSPRTG